MKILIVEDDSDTRSYLKTRLEEKGYAIDEAADGKRGLFLAKTESYDLILFDYGLPEKDGFEVCRDLRESKSNAPIIMISVIGEIPHKVTGLTIGADDYMTKPFFFDELHARIQTILRRPPVRQSPTISVADLTIDMNRQKVFRGESSIYLTKKEFALLEFMARHHGSIVSRGAITEHVWDSDIDPFSNTIETHILNLRKKIDTGRRKKLIHSVPGRGYKLDTEK